MLQGALTLSEALCPRNDRSVLQHFYEDSLPFRPAHLAAQHLVERVVSRRALDWPLRVLEIGSARHAGALVSPFVSPGEVECVIDGPEGTWAEADPGWFDLVVARCALHAAREPERLLARAARVTAEAGLLVAVEPVRAPAWWRFVLGLTELMAGEPAGGGAAAWAAPAVVSPAMLRRSGWSALLCGGSPRAARGLKSPACGLTLAERPAGAAPRASSPAPAGPAADAPATWVVFADAGGRAARLAGILDRRGARVVVVRPGGVFRSLGPSLLEIDPASGRTSGGRSTSRRGTSAPGRCAASSTWERSTSPRRPAPRRAGPRPGSTRRRSASCASRRPS